MSYIKTREGRYRSGQTGQTVNLLALRLRWFESSPAHFPLNGGVFAFCDVGKSNLRRGFALPRLPLDRLRECAVFCTSRRKTRTVVTKQKIEPINGPGAVRHRGVGRRRSHRLRHRPVAEVREDALR